MAGCCRVMFEREGHPYKFRVIPGATEKLEIDRIAAVVQSGWKHNCRHAVGRAWRVAAAETGSASTAVIYCDLAQQTGINDCIDAHAVGARRIHPSLHDVLASHSVITLRPDFRRRHSRRWLCRACSRISADICNLLLRAVHIDRSPNLETLRCQFGMAIDVLHPAF